MTDREQREAAMGCIVELVQSVADQLDGKALVGADERLAGVHPLIRQEIAELIDTALVTITVDWEGGLSV